MAREERLMEGTARRSGAQGRCLWRRDAGCEVRGVCGGDGEDGIVVCPYFAQRVRRPSIFSGSGFALRCIVIGGIALYDVWEMVQ